MSTLRRGSHWYHMGLLTASERRCEILDLEELEELKI